MSKSCRLWGTTFFLTDFQPRSSADFELKIKLLIYWDVSNE